MVMMAIDRKMFRDLWHMKGQMLAILLIIAAGVSLFVAMLAALESLKMVRDDYYAQERLGDVFASCKRAPDSLADRVKEIPGVDVVQTRVAVGVTLEVPGLEEPASGNIVSIPDGEHPSLNDIYLRTGRLPSTKTEGEVLVIESFAGANAYKVEDSLTAVINGRRKDLRIVGIALSPEYVYALPPGAVFPDDRLYGVLWMNETELAGAYDMEGAFNDLSLSLTEGASEGTVIERVDTLLEPYGGQGAYPRKDQQSYWYLENEFQQLESFGIMIPVIFLGVAGFLLNIVVGRMIKTQREQIAALKAFGYSNLQIAIHYGQLIGLVILTGGGVGTLAGWLLGDAMIDLYQAYFQFPELKFHMPAWVPVVGVLSTAAASGLGTINSVRRAAKLPPAEAMRPEAPPTYKSTLIEKLGLQRWLSQPSRMILRHLERRPIQAGLSIIGISFAVMLMVMMTAMIGIMEYVVQVQENLMHREDIEVTFYEPRSRAALYEIEAMPGVLYVEPFRSVPARLRFEHRSRRLAIRGLPRGGMLEQVLDRELKPIRIPEHGLLISSVLAENLSVSAGDFLTVEVMEGRRPTRQIQVSGLIDDFFGVGAYMQLEALNRLMNEGDVISSVKFTTDGRNDAKIFEQLRERPSVASAASKGSVIAALKKQLNESLMVMITMSLLFAGIIAFGVIYNTARISLSERARELASLRVLGLTRGEISYILLGELGILTLASLPVGMLMGYGATVMVMQSLNSEVMRFPTVISSSSYALAAITILGAAIVSGLVVRRRLNNLDLIEVLKTRD